MKNLHAIKSLYIHRLKPINSEYPVKCEVCGIFAKVFITGTAFERRGSIKLHMSHAHHEISIEWLDI